MSRSSPTATLPDITDALIAAQVTPASLARGRAYARDGAIVGCRRSGMTLIARCRGSRPEPYRLLIAFDERDVVEAVCSCPVGEAGTCKHVAALLLSYRDQPDGLAVTEGLAEALARRTKPELIELIQYMLAQEPGLEPIVAMRLPGGPAPERPSAAVHRDQAASAAVHREQAASAFERGQTWDGDYWGAEPAIASKLDAIKQLGDRFLDEDDPAAAFAVYSGLTDEVLGQFELLHDEDGQFASLVSQCVDGIGACLCAPQLPRAMRIDVLKALYDVYFFDSGFGGIGIGDEVPLIIVDNASPDERARVADWGRTGMPVGDDWRARNRRRRYGGFVLALESDLLDDDTYLQRCREYGQPVALIQRLIELDRVDEAHAEAARLDDDKIVELVVDVFVLLGESRRAIQLVEDHVADSESPRLLSWLVARHQARGDDQAALDAAVRWFHSQPTLAVYDEVKAIAAAMELPARAWSRVRDELMAVVEDPEQAVLRVAISVLEGEIDDAVAFIRGGARVPSRYLLDLAEAARDAHPEAVIEIYRDHAESLIERGGRANYRLACRYLANVRELSLQCGREQAWRVYIATLRNTRRSLRALIEELRAAGL